MDKPEKVEVGQVWADNDIRSDNQEFTVEEVDGEYAYVRRGKRKSTIRLERLYLNGQRGYRYLGRSK